MRTPTGIILHSTRSSSPTNLPVQEYRGTVNYVRNGTDGITGWNVTVGPDIIAEHLHPKFWGWNAREHSQSYLAIEFAQTLRGVNISDAQINAAAWWIRNVALREWPELPMSLPEHRELPAGIRDGKSDIGADQNVRGRLLRRLQEP